MARHFLSKRDLVPLFLLAEICFENKHPAEARVYVLEKDLSKVGKFDDWTILFDDCLLGSSFSVVLRSAVVFVVDMVALLGCLRPSFGSLLVLQGPPREPEYCYLHCKNNDCREGTGAADENKKRTLGGPLGLLWGTLGGPLGSLGLPLGSAGPPLAPPLAILGAPWARSGGPRVYLGACFASRIRFGTHFGSPKASLGTILGPNGSQRGSRRASTGKISGYQIPSAQPMQRPHHQSDQWTFIPYIPARRNARSD